MKKSHPLLAIAVAGLSLVPLAPAWAWGERGHAQIDRAAIATLPADGPVFLRKYADYAAASASLPDSWRQDLAPFSKADEDPNHGWFREQFQFIKVIPRSRIAFILALHDEQERIASSDPASARLMNVRWTGTLPYAIMEAYGRLVTGFRTYRWAVGKGRPTGAIEANCAFYFAWLGHYVGDGSQPLHVSIHHDGWQGDNPNGYTQDRTIHSRFESRYVEMLQVAAKDIASHEPPANPLNGDLFDTVLRYLDTSSQRVEEIYKLEKAGAFAKPGEAEAQSLTFERLGAGAAMLRDLTDRAWRESALPPVHLKPGANDPNNPAYDPLTGSIPAPVSPQIP